MSERRAVIDIAGRIDRGVGRVEKYQASICSGVFCHCSGGLVEYIVAGIFEEMAVLGGEGVLDRVKSFVTVVSIA